MARCFPATNLKVKGFLLVLRVCHNNNNYCFICVWEVLFKSTSIYKPSATIRGKKNICYSNRMDVGSDFHFFVSSVLKYGLVARRSLAVFVLLLNKKTCLLLTVHCLQLLKLKKFTCFGCGINWFEIIFCLMEFHLSLFSNTVWFVC